MQFKLPQIVLHTEMHRMQFSSLLVGAERDYSTHYKHLAARRKEGGGQYVEKSEGNGSRNCKNGWTGSKDEKGEMGRKKEEGVLSHL